MGITAILLAAGYATRLYPLTRHQPKSLLPLGRGVILDAVLRAVDDVPNLSARILVTNHQFAGFFQAWQAAGGAEVRIVDDGTDSPETRLGAIRDLELARRFARPEDDLLVVGTDNLFRWSLAAFVEQAQRVASAPSVALWRAPSADAATQFGVVVRDPTGRIGTFAEKSPTPPSMEVALCVYYFPAAMCGQVQTFLDDGGNPDAPGYFIEWLVHRNAVYGVMMPGAWYDIGTLDAYRTVVAEWDRDSAGR